MDDLQLRPSATPAAPDRPASSDRWRLLADLVVFQAKLVLNGLVGVVLAPATIIAAVVGLVTTPHDPGRHFRGVLGAGRKAEDWLGVYERAGGGRREAGLDAEVARLERALVEIDARGGGVARLRLAVDRILDRLGERRRDRSA